MKNAFLQSVINSDIPEKRNLGTFTSIHCNSEVKKYFSAYLNKNLVDKKGYQSLTYFEYVIDTFFKDVFKHVKGKTILTSGSTESILLALYYAREEAKHKRHVTKPNILIPEHAHYSFFNCAKMLNIEVKKIALNDRFSVDTEEVKKKIDKNTILLVGILGSTELGVVDDMRELDAIAAKAGIGFHMDAAIGGFVIPFVQSNIPHTFTELKSLVSVNISGHKFGLSLPGCGVLLMRDSSTTQEHSDSVSYLSSGSKQIENLLITSSSLGAMSLAINILTYGRTGYEKFAKKYLKVKKDFMKFLTEEGIEFFSGSDFTPQLFIYGKDVQKLSDFLKEKNWLQSTYTPKVFNKSGIRFVIKKGQEKVYQTELVNDVILYYNTNSTQRKVQEYETPFVGRMMAKTYEEENIWQDQ